MPRVRLRSRARSKHAKARERNPDGSFVSNKEIDKRVLRSGGRKSALEELDRMLGRATNRKTLRGALQSAFDQDPFAFFRGIVMPLLPKESLMRLDSGSPALGVNIILTQVEDTDKLLSPPGVAPKVVESTPLVTDKVSNALIAS